MKKYENYAMYWSDTMFINDAIRNLEEYLENNRRFDGQNLYVFYDVDERNFYTDNGYTEREMSKSVFTVLSFDNLDDSMSSKQQIEKIRRRLYREADQYNEGIGYF